MSIQLVHKVLVQCSADTTASQKLFWIEDLDSALVTISGYDNEADGLIKMPLATTYQTLSLGTVQSPCGIYVQVNAPVTLNFNATLSNGVVSGGTQIPLQPNSAATGTLAKFFAEMTFQSLIVTSQPNQAVGGLYCVWGDPASN